MPHGPAVASTDDQTGFSIGITGQLQQAFTVDRRMPAGQRVADQCWLALPELAHEAPGGQVSETAQDGRRVHMGIIGIARCILPPLEGR
jgi:hypothetical protein